MYYTQASDAECVSLPPGRGESATGVARWPGQGPGEAQARPGAGNRAGGDREPGSVWGEGHYPSNVLSVI